MKQVLISILNACFRWCKYNAITFTDKLTEMTDRDYEIVCHDRAGNTVNVDVNGTCTIILTLSDNDHIQTIDVIEK